MIRITIEPGRVTARGHAGYAPEGSDIVCAAVSILLYTLAQRLRELEQAGAVTVSGCELEPGDAVIQWAVKSGQWTVAGERCSPLREDRQAVAFFTAGARLVAARYPRNVTVEDGRSMTAPTGEWEGGTRTASGKRVPYGRGARRTAGCRPYKRLRRRNAHR